jgi:methionine biosynthesis protein MetW
MTDDALTHLGDEDLSAFARLMAAKADPAPMDATPREGTSFPRPAEPSSPPPAGRAPRRWQDRMIVTTIPEGASVLDLGCGRGDLLAQLHHDRRAHVQGVELDARNVLACMEHGVPVFQADLDQGLSGFTDGSFDYVVLEETLQTLKRPDLILAEMLRVGKKGIVSFPNFGCWRVRLDLGVRGRMPVSEILPHPWYDSPNIHLCSLRDFLEHARERGYRAHAIHVCAEGRVRPFEAGDNLQAEEALVVLGAGGT